MIIARTYTCRGNFPWIDNTQNNVLPPQRIRLWNGSWTDNWTVEKIEIIITGADETNDFSDNNMHHLVIATERGGALAGFSTPGTIAGETLRDNRQIWWGSIGASGQQVMTVLDPDHLFVQDLWINGWITDSTTGLRYALEQEIGFLITLKSKRTKIAQTVLSLIKEQAQDTPE